MIILTRCPRALAAAVFALLAWASTRPDAFRVERRKARSESTR
jgi:hypothetical protein